MYKQLALVSLGSVLLSLGEAQAADFSERALVEAVSAYNENNNALKAMQNLEQSGNGFVPLMLNRCFKYGAVGCTQNLNKAQQYSKSLDEIQQQLQTLAAKNNDEAYNWLGNLERAKENDIGYQQALFYFEKSNNLKNPYASYALGQMYQLGQGVKQNNQTAFEYYIQAANLGYPIAMLNLGIAFENGMGITVDYSQALDWYEKAANLGDFKAMVQIGKMYQLGRGVPKSYKDAMAWYKTSIDVEKAYKSGKSYNPVDFPLPQIAQRAMNSSYPIQTNITPAKVFDFSEQALHQASEAYEHPHSSLHEMQSLEQTDNGYITLMLGDCFKNGNSGCIKDLEKAKKYINSNDQIQSQLELLAKKNNAIALCWLSRIYREKDEYDQQLVYLQKSANLKYAPAMNLLGRYYYAGNNKDLTKAFEWFEKSAQKGNANALRNLGIMYAQGEAVREDKYKAFEYYKKAANLGMLISMNEVAHAYANGIGVEQNNQEAFKWYKQASDLGDSSAMNQLGLMYENGQGVELDKQQAIAWYKKAKELGNTEAKKNLSRLDPSMLAIVGKGVGKGLIGSVKIVGSVLGGVVDILASPELNSALQQSSANMQREIDRKHKQDLEVKAWSAQRAAEKSRERLNSSSAPSYSSSSSSARNSSVKTSTSSSSAKSSATESSYSSTSKTNTKDVTQKNVVMSSDEKTKIAAQKKLERENAYKLEKEQKQLFQEKEEKQRQLQFEVEKKQYEIQLANEKREADRQAEKAREQRERLAEENRLQQEKQLYLLQLSNSIRLKARSCYGDNYIVGIRPRTSKDLVSYIDVHYRAYCPSGGRYSGIAKNFQGISTDCFMGDTFESAGNLIPKTLSCKAEDMTVEVIKVTEGK